MHVLYCATQSWISLRNDWAENCTTLSIKPGDLVVTVTSLLIAHWLTSSSLFLSFTSSYLFCCHSIPLLTTGSSGTYSPPIKCAAIDLAYPSTFVAFTFSSNPRSISSHHSSLSAHHHSPHTYHTDTRDSLCSSWSPTTPILAVLHTAAALPSLCRTIYSFTVCFVLLAHLQSNAALYVLLGSTWKICVLV